MKKDSNEEEDLFDPNYFNSKYPVKSQPGTPLAELPKAVPVPTTPKPETPSQQRVRQREDSQQAKIKRRQSIIQFGGFEKDVKVKSTKDALIGFDFEKNVYAPYHNLNKFNEHSITTQKYSKRSLEMEMELLKLQLTSSTRNQQIINVKQNIEILAQDKTFMLQREHTIEENLTELISITLKLALTHLHKIKNQSQSMSNSNNVISGTNNQVGQIQVMVDSILSIAKTSSPKNYILAKKHYTVLNSDMERSRRNQYRGSVNNLGSAMIFQRMKEGRRNRSTKSRDVLSSRNFNISRDSMNSEASHTSRRKSGTVSGSSRESSRNGNGSQSLMGRRASTEREQNQMKALLGKIHTRNQQTAKDSRLDVPPIKKIQGKGAVKGIRKGSFFGSTANSTAGSITASSNGSSNNSRLGLGIPLRGNSRIGSRVGSRRSSNY